MKKTDDIQKQLSELLSKRPLEFDKILSLSNELVKLDPDFQRFFVDAKTLIHLGRDSIKDHTTALLELVKNSYDADANNVEIEIYSKGKDLIRIADNGFGMTENELKNNWLRIGFSEKRTSKTSQSGRRKTGEKGIGRISTDRLGARLEIRTKSKNDDLVGLSLNWDDFDVDGKNISDIKVELTKPKEILLPRKSGEIAKTGTEILITQQRQPWTKRNVENLYTELSSLTPPFENVSDFSISFINDIEPNVSKEIDANYLNAAEIELEAYYDGKDEKIVYTFKDKYKKKEIIESVSWKNLITKSDFDNDAPNTDNLRCGSVTLKLYFFLRQAASVKDTDFNLTDLREFIDNNQGIKIYRDRIVVKPYGFPSSQFGYDWLNLADRKAQNPAGISRSEDYRVTPNQLVGAAFISRDSNMKLSDSAAREGFVESEAFIDLKYFVLGSINMLESYRAKLLPEINKTKKTNTSNNADTEKIIKALSEIESDLSEISSEIDESSDIEESVKEKVQLSLNNLTKTTRKVDKTINELLNWNRTLSGLATIGISSAVFGHEDRRVNNSI